MPKALVYFLGSMCFAGSSPVLRGTVGTAVAATLIFLAWRYCPGWPWWWTLPAGLGVFIFGWVIAAQAVRLFDKDPKWFVLDEAAAMLLVATGLRELSGAPDWLAIACGFFFFRVFDMLKPPPIKQVERAVKGGLGVMIDDVAAAVIAWPLALGAAWVAVRALAT